MITQRPFCLKGRQQLSWRLGDARLGHELSRRNCPAYPQLEWFAALAVADCEQPCEEPLEPEKPTLGARRVEARCNPMIRSHILARGLLSKVRTGQGDSRKDAELPQTPKVCQAFNLFKKTSVETPA